jgi:hypothetical protein
VLLILMPLGKARSMGDQSVLQNECSVGLTTLRLGVI